MTLRGKLVQLFALFQVGTCFTILVFPFMDSKSALERLGWIAAVIGIIYLLPPLLYRLHERIAPVKEGLSDISGGLYTPWWTGHQLQGLFLAFSFLETLLRLVPGLYGAWLRLWGAKVGKAIYWTPCVEITDRGLLEIGDYVVFGHRSALCSHVIHPRGDQLKLLVKRIRIESQALIGSEVKLGPGAFVATGVAVPYGTVATLNKKFLKVRDSQQELGK